MKPIRSSYTETQLAEMGYRPAFPTRCRECGAELVCYELRRDPKKKLFLEEGTLSEHFCTK